MDQLVQAAIAVMGPAAIWLSQSRRLALCVECAGIFAHRCA